MRTLNQIGEFGLIDQIRARTPKASGVKAGIGDDAAVLQGDANRDWLFKTDMIIEGRHFRTDRATPFEIGWKAMAVNVSDMAAMGGVPVYALVAAGFPGSLSEKFLKKMQDGMNAVCRRFGAAIVGGDTNKSDRIILAVSLLGRVPKNRAVLRSGARPGDAVFVTGSLGGSYASKKHLRFVPRVAEAQYLVKNISVHAMMDISDGLGSDIFHIASESGVGVLLDEKAIPVSRAAKGICGALSDGEDFELLFTVSGKDAAQLQAKWPKKLAPLSRIGEVTRSKGVAFLGTDGVKRALKRSGFDHFKNS